MAFKMRSGNKVSFKNMGSSPAKDMKTGSYEHSFESPAKQVKDKVGPVAEKSEDFVSKEEAIKYVKDVLSKRATDRKVKKAYKTLQTKKESPAKQKLPGVQGEGQDQDKIFNNKGEHVGDWVDGKKVMHTKKSPAKQYDHSEDVKTNIKNQSKRDKISNDAKKAASVLDGTSEKVATNTELKEQNKSYKQDQRGVDTPGGRRRTRSERIEAKDSDLELRGIAAEDNEARGEGKRGFSWKNAGMAALEGQGLMGAVRSGIGTGDYKSTTIKRKQTKRAGKAERKVTKATQKENRVAKRAARRNKVKKASDLSTEI